MANADLVFYGVRGSYPVSHRNIMEYGGNTASILIDHDGDKAVVLDAGTGIIGIGNYLVKEKPDVKKIYIFVSHLHIDHIQGLPFFEPVFHADYSINIYCDDSGKNVFRETIYSLFNRPLSPISNKGIKAVLNFVRLKSTLTGTVIVSDAIRVDYIKEYAHPLSGVLLFRVNVDDKKVVYATDIESPDGFSDAFCRFSEEADVLIHDSQYFDEEYYTSVNSKRGFGHSTVSMATANAVNSRVKKLFLFHYSPECSDAEAERMLGIARQTFKETYLAKELIKTSLRR